MPFSGIFHMTEAIRHHTHRPLELPVAPELVPL